MLSDMLILLRWKEDHSPVGRRQGLPGSTESSPISTTFMSHQSEKRILRWEIQAGNSLSLLGLVFLGPDSKAQKYYMTAGLGGSED